MINTTGTILLVADSFIAYHSPKIVITGQASDINDIGVIKLTVNVSNQNGSLNFNTTIQVSTDSIQELLTLNPVDSSIFVANLYSILEALLVKHLEALNPDSTFEIV